jgi:hypothetical protein
MLQPMAHLQDLGTSTPLSPSGDINTGPGKSIIIRQAITEEVIIGGASVWSVWDGELHDGKGTLTTGIAGQKGPFKLTCGEIYIRSTTQTGEPSAQYLQGPVPVVITKGTVVAGSVGTHWYVWSDCGKKPTTWFVLLRHANEPVGRVEVYDSGKSAFISLANHCLELPNDQLPAGAMQKPIPKGSLLEQKVQAAVARAVWQTS